MESVAGAAADSGKISVGDMLVSINGRETGASTFRETMHLLKNTSRPLRLVLRAQATAAPSAAPVQPSAALPRTATSSMASESWPCYTVQDPTGGFPEDITLVVGMAGVQVIATATRANVCFWPWKQIAKWKPQLQSDDPTDMELITIDVLHMGQFVLECDSGTLVSASLQKRLTQLMERQAGQAQSTQQVSSTSFNATMSLDPTQSLPRDVIVRVTATSFEIAAHTHTQQTLLSFRFADIARYGVVAEEYHIVAGGGGHAFAPNSKFGFSRCDAPAVHAAVKGRIAALVARQTSSR